MAVPSRVLIGATGCSQHAYHLLFQAFVELADVFVGARRDGVWRMILRQGLFPVGVGLALGTVLSLALGRFVGSLLYEVEPGDPATYAAMLAVLAVVAALAVGVPAWRASRVDPLVALRYE